MIPGESEYWFAMIKVLMIILFIIVGLIFDWGGVIGHPGPVRPEPLTSYDVIALTAPCSGPLQLRKRTSVHRRLLRVCTDLHIRVLLVWRCRARNACRGRVCITAQECTERGPRDVLPHIALLRAHYSYDRALHQLRRPDTAQCCLRYVARVFR